MPYLRKKTQDKIRVYKELMDWNSQVCTSRLGSENIIIQHFYELSNDEIGWIKFAS